MATKPLSLKTNSVGIAASAYEAQGVGNTLNVLENQSIVSYIIGSMKFVLITVWAGIVAVVGGIAYLKEMAKTEETEPAQ